MRRSLPDLPDYGMGLGLMLAALLLYGATLLPGLGAGDTAEFQRVATTLGLAHATGYPLYTLLGWAWVQLLPLGSPAWRMNLFSALIAAMALAVLYQVGRELGQRRVVAASVALALGSSISFWMQATRAEVYALAALLQALLLLVLLRWRAAQLPLWAVGLAVGLGLAHHRSIVLQLPGLLAFIALTRWPRPKELAGSLLALLAPLLLYLYVPWRAEPWQQPWQLLLEYTTASAAQDWLDPGRLQQQGLSRPLELARLFVWPQFLAAGALLALAGSLGLARRDRSVAALLLISYALVFGFCAAYYAVDVEVFFIPGHLLQALLIGEGAMLLLNRVPGRAASASGLLLLALPALLLVRNLERVQGANDRQPELAARAVMAEPLEPHALLIGDWSYIEGLRYLQSVEKLHPQVEFGYNTERQRILDVLAAGRAVYLTRPEPRLGLAQEPDGPLWRVRNEALQIEQLAPANLRWEDGIALLGFQLQPGPYRPGESVALICMWAAQTPPQRAYSFFVHLVASDGRVWGQHDGAPLSAPTDQWRPGERYTEIMGPLLSSQAPPGRYQVLVGWYEYPSLRRLKPAAGTTAPGDHVLLGEIEVIAP